MSGSEVTAEVPDLPNYDMRPFPAVRAVITAASLKSGAPAAKAAEQQVVAVVAEQPTGGLQLTPTNEAASSGLMMVPKGAEEAVGAAASLPTGRLQNVGGQQYVVVEAGDTLGTLAELIYGDAGLFRKIYEANQDSLSSPDDVTEGMLLRVPE